MAWIIVLLLLCGAFPIALCIAGARADEAMRKSFNDWADKEEQAIKLIEENNMEYIPYTSVCIMNDYLSMYESDVKLITYNPEYCGTCGRHWASHI